MTALLFENIIRQIVYFQKYDLIYLHKEEVDLMTYVIFKILIKNLLENLLDKRQPARSNNKIGKFRVFIKRKWTGK